MSAADRYAETKPYAQLTRAQLAARAAVLRDAVDLLWTQSRMDGGPMIEAVGLCKSALRHTE